MNEVIVLRIEALGRVEMHAFRDVPSAYRSLRAYVEWHWGEYTDLPLPDDEDQAIVDYFICSGEQYEISAVKVLE